MMSSLPVSFPKDKVQVLGLTSAYLLASSLVTLSAPTNELYIPHTLADQESL